MILGKLNILIADDDAGDRRQLRRALKETGLSYECVETTSIEGALEACDKSAFDCAIVDYRMPGYDGLHGIAALHDRLPYMPVIMSTGQGDETVATEAMKCGASDYIAKGHIHARSIRRAIESAVEKATMRRRMAQQRDDLEKFAFVLVHDLKAPITSVRAFAAFIEESVRSETTDKEKIISHCQRVVGAAHRMCALIDTLSEYTRADGQVTFEAVDMDRVMEDTLSNLQQAIENRGACVTHDGLPVVFGNAPQLVQLMQNLIGNGIKYCEHTPPTVQVAAKPDLEDGWLFAVRDNGIGISQECYQQVFEPFSRLHDRSKFEGTGLGLATCKKIVERHGGVIWCESTLHQGTTFFFKLPNCSAGA
jgi:light-regulated signal transduction histidine kinase (bacteriophytochrome)